MKRPKIFVLVKNFEGINHDIEIYDSFRAAKREFRENRDSIVTERDAFLAANPEEPEQWIRANSALVGKEIEERSSEGREVWFMSLTLQELWGLDRTTSKKIVGIWITLIVELTIILFIFLSERDVRRNVMAGIKRNSSRKRRNQSKCHENRLEKFVTLYRDYFEENGSLPPMRKISPGLREVRRELEKADREDLERIFNGN